MWSLHPQYIDNEMLLDMYFEGNKVLQVFQGNRHFTRDEARYYPHYFMYAMLNSHPQKVILLARYLFWISEILKFQRNIEVDISCLPMKSIFRSTKEQPIKMYVPSKLIEIERETMEKRLKQHRRASHQNLIAFPPTGAQSNPVIDIVVGDATMTMREQVCGYNVELQDYSAYINSNYLKE